MTNQQGAPEALTLAGAVDHWARADYGLRGDEMRKAAAELRRQHARIAELEDALSSCLQLVNQLNEHHIPDGCSRLIRHIKDSAATPPAQADSQPAMTTETVYAAIAHGDQDHRAWLLSALRAVWCGEAVPPVASPIADATADSVLEDAADPLQGAANWLVKAHSGLETSTLAGKLSIGYNRAKRLHDAAIAARKQGANHD